MSKRMVIIEQVRKILTTSGGRPSRDKVIAQMCITHDVSWRTASECVKIAEKTS